ncbi:Glycogen branching enzyme, GH-57-type, archaeal [Acidisarcina polymorpha]|uniref:Glycogen branching enzyme, GH-57-type, archaeal n=1 Tax=Acidisarcina polymorpha TaxID=2211140 RepID=A0A2Z5G9A1_9BACT|nr:1,4-alpha-glucan branching protein domain-containing protein [Acidisarcina polymorpha]AXC15145.1 Glycogen branching enzyme, GH-57-type, archaeal [Acidisarcina polymorpha]
MKNGKPSAYLSFTLHAHLPYVLHHGTWPHGLEWLHEAAAETYLPLLGVLRRLERDGLALKANLSLSPVLMEQLRHPTFKEEFPKYIERKMISAREDENYFRQNGEFDFAETAVFWESFFERTLKDFYDLDRDIVSGLRYFNDTGSIEILACAATHGYLPLLGTDESVVAQIRAGVAAHERHLGKKPHGFWVPECGYRPAGLWQTPIVASGEEGPRSPFRRIGVEEALAEAGIEYFFVDTHLVEESILFTPYKMMSGDLGLRLHNLPAHELKRKGDLKSIYRPYLVEGPLAHAHPVTIFPRDPQTGLQVWSGDTGYPADGNYLDFHKKRWPGGHQYWRVTEAQSDMALKAPYFPQEALARTHVHAEHFTRLVQSALEDGYSQERPPILSSLFDAELFGHWWFEGPVWLEQVVRIFAQDDVGIELTTGSQYLSQFAPEVFLDLGEGSWGKNGNNEVWLNDQTSWTWSDIYRAEEVMREIATQGRWRDDGWGLRIAKQMARELLLLESSDWQFLITTAAARDYAEKRFRGHLEQFIELEMLWAEFVSNGGLSPSAEQWLAELEERDCLFAEIDPGLWARR